MPTIPTAPVAAAALIGGYYTAATTRSRPLGGAVLAAGSIWCAQAWTRRRSLPTAALLTAAQLGAFGASHPLSRKIGAWPSVLCVSAAVAILAGTAVDSRQPAAD